MPSYSDIMDDLKRYNLCTYHLLPLIGLRTSDFGDMAFSNCFINRSGTRLITRVVDKNLIPDPNKILRHKRFLKAWDMEDGSYYSFVMPPEFITDVERYMEGKYSEYSDKAKQLIRTNSGLPWNEPNDFGTAISTDTRLRALDKGDEILRQFWENELDTVLDPNQELLPKPSAETYMEIENG